MPLWKTKNKKSKNNMVVVEAVPNGAVNGEVHPQEDPVAVDRINGEVCHNTDEGACQNNTDGKPHPTPLPVSLGKVATSNKENGNSKSNETKKEVELLVIIKDFKGSNKKEMTVHRGQVVQRMYSCGTWLNVQDVDGRTGYIPTEVCCPKEEVADAQWCEMNRDELMDRIYENIPDKPVKPVPTAFPYNSISSTNSPSLSRRSSFPDTPHSNGVPQRVPVRKLSTGTPMGVIQLSDSSSPVPRYSIEHILHPLHPLSITRSHMSSDNSQTSSTLRRCSEDSINPSTPAIQPLLAHNRNDSYMEAVVETAEDKGASTPAKSCNPRISIKRPSDLPILPMYNNLGQQQRLDTVLTSNGLIANGQLTSESQASCLADDVFLPCIQKPVGIYEVMKSYEKQSEGEVTITKGEYVIAMQMGYGEWASVMTASNAEGLVPRGHLCRYSPLSRSSNKVSASTQTELIIMAPVVHQQSTCTSSSSSAASRHNGDIVCIRDIRPTSTPKKNIHRSKEMAIPIDHNHLSVLDYGAWEDSRLNLVDDLWYENSMSIPRLPHNDSLYSNEAPSVCTLPALNGVVNQVRGDAPLAFHSSRESLPQFPPINGYNRHSLNKRQGPCNNLSPATIRRTLKEQSDWPMSPGILSNFSELSSSPRSPQMIVLKATKDFTPDVDGTDYLTFCKGDILHLIPGNNPYKGWLWVHHVKQRCYGYVPKTHVTNAGSQDTSKHKNGLTVQYDEV